MKCHKCLFLWDTFPEHYQTSSFDLNIWEVGRFNLGVTQPAVCWSIMVYFLGFVCCSCFLRIIPIIPYNLRLFFFSHEKNPVPLHSAGFSWLPTTKRRKERPRVFVTGRWRKRSAWKLCWSHIGVLYPTRTLHVWFTYRNPKDSVSEDWGKLRENEGNHHTPCMVYFLTVLHLIDLYGKCGWIDHMGIWWMYGICLPFTCVWLNFYGISM